MTRRSGGTGGSGIEDNPSQGRKVAGSGASANRDKRHMTTKVNRACKVTIDGFPEIIAYSSYCELCKMHTEYPDEIRLVHGMAKDGKTAAEIDENMRGVLAALDRKNIPAYRIQTHLDEHVCLDDVVISTHVPGIAPSAVAPRGQIPPPQSEGEEHADYRDMWGLWDRLKPFLERYESDIRAKARHTMLSGYDLGVLTSLLREGRSILESVYKIRTSDRLMKSILNTHAKNFAQRLGPVLGDRLRVIHARLESGEDSKVVAAELAVLLDEELPPIFSAAARSAMEASSEQYGLH